MYMEINVLGYKLRVEVIIACIVLGWVICTTAVCSCSKISLKEGLVTLADAAPLDYHPDGGVKNSWMNKAVLYAKDMGYNSIVKKHSQYKGTAVPLAPENMLFFKNNAFKPECCPSTYSSSQGCACTSSDQVNYLNQRGGNRTEPSNF
jgi:hypothetical protein